MPTSDAALVRAIAEASRRLTRTRIDDFLVTKGFYSLSTLRNDPAYQGLSKRELLDLVFEEREHWQLIEALADEGAFSDETVVELRQIGFLNANAADDISDPPQQPPPQSPVEPRRDGQDLPAPRSARTAQARGLKARWAGLSQGLKVAIIVAAISGIAVIIGAIINYFGATAPVQLSISATQTAERLATITAPTASPDPATPPPLTASTASPIPTASKPPQLPEATIFSPQQLAKVTERAAVEGSVSSIAPGIRVFLCVRASAPGGRIYPQAEVTLSGNWAIDVVFQTSGALYDVFVLAASSEDSIARLSDPHYKAAGMVELPPDASIISNVVTVTRD